MCSECEGAYVANPRLARMYLSELAGINPCARLSEKYVMDRMLCIYQFDDYFAEKAAKGITTVGGLAEKLIHLSNESED